MSIRTPDDDFYMDTGATSHITSDPGTLQKVFNSSNVRSILVGNGNSIPDLSSRKTILRCDSSGELYPITTSAVQSSFSPPPHQYSLAVCSPTVWHSRLGHPGKAVLDALRTKSFIQCSSHTHNPQTYPLYSFLDSSTYPSPVPSNSVEPVPTLTSAPPPEQGPSPSPLYTPPHRRLAYPSQPISTQPTSTQPTSTQPISTQPTSPLPISI
ncbi:extensin-like [Papaver somniferum]|uniref:extensin-like n=1 Tax=Papaver somniferum TaxID=3469 RepID=UPI000E6FC0C3|nr:extensin-like [Papaver somniferum]